MGGRCQHGLAAILEDHGLFLLACCTCALWIKTGKYTASKTNFHILYVSVESFNHSHFAVLLIKLQCNRTSYRTCG